MSDRHIRFTGMKGSHSHIGLTARLADRAAVVTVRFPDDDASEIRVNRSTVRTSDKSQGVIVCVIGGRGLIARETSSAPDIVAKVTSEVDEDGRNRFVWTFSDDGGEIAFARRDSIVKALEQLEDVKDRIMDIECIPHNASGIDDIPDTARSRAREKLGIGMLAPDAGEFSSNIAMLLVRRLLLPVLIAVLLLVGLNAAVSRSVGERLSREEARLTAMEREIGRQDDMRRTRQAALSRYMTSIIPGSPALLCGKIGKAVPGDMVLTLLELQPAKKTFSSSRYPEVACGEAVVEGTAPDYATVQEFMKALEGCCGNICLAGMDKDGEGFSFRITMRL